MDILERLRQIKIKLWIAVGVLLGLVIVLVVVIVAVAFLLQTWEARNAPKITKNRIGIELVSTPPGSFLLGSENGRGDEKPVHQVMISKGFLIGRYEVTQGQWKTVMGRDPVNFKGNDSPVQFVTWNETQEFIARRGCSRFHRVNRRP